MYTKKIQRNFLRNLIITLILITGLLLIFQQTYDNFVRESISKSYISELAAQAEKEFNLYNQPVLNNLLLAQKWGQSGLLRLKNPELLNATFIPILDQTPQIYAVKLVDSLGNYYSLTRKRDTWETIISNSEKKTNKSLYQELSAKGKLISKRWDKNDYPPLKRPWYIGARDSVSGNKAFWTQARHIISAQSPGITASISWRNRENSIFVLAFDVLLKSIYNTLTDLVISENSQVFLFRNDGSIFNVASLDASPNDDENNIQFFIDHSEVGKPLISTSLKMWHNAEFESNEPLKFKYKNINYWCGFRPIQTERLPLWIGFVLPEKDLFGPLQEEQELLIIAFIIIIILGIIIIVWLVRGYRNQMARGPDSLIDDPNIEKRIKDLINKGESIKSEFKSTMRMNLKTGQSGREIEMAWLKTVCAFMNSNGGVLLFGIQDDGQIVGIEADNFENEDRIRLHFKNLINQHVGAEFSSSLRFHVLTLSEMTVAVLECEPSSKPVFLKNKSEEFFYIRTGPSSIKLSASKTLKYLENRKSRVSKQSDEF